MAMEFLPADDPKQTIEKQVRQKPSVQDLTTIESPGRPVPADEIDEIPEKKTRKRTVKTPKSSLVSQEKNAILIITEKPQAAAKIAAALGDAKRYTEGKVSYYEVERGKDKLLIASAVGHLFNLVVSQGQVGWPVFKTEWKPAYLKNSYMKPYHETLAKLARRAGSYIVATDFDNEGEVIGWNVLRFIAKQATAKRMKFSTLTKEELVNAYEHPLPTLAWGQAYAGETRHVLDWMYGINLSRALMSAIKKTGTFRILSIGRVQGPALKIIVEREREIEAFKPAPYWNVDAWAKGIEFNHPQDIFDKKELQKFEGITKANAHTTTKEESIAPPYPFDLTTLQREAYAKHHINPSGTLKAAQNLYLAGLISYPRTSSQKIPKEIEPKKILAKLGKHYEFVKQATRPMPIEGPKSDPAHPSIYPTGEFKRIEGDEEKLYDLIVRRFIAAFSPDAFVERKNITLQAGNVSFTANGLVIHKDGWSSVYPASFETRDLPTMEGETIIDKLEITEKETQPPRRYTPASLITLLEKKNLGTKTTRSLIIDTLLDRGYLEGQSLQPTPLGMKLIATLEQYAPIIIDENLTKELEEQMEFIESMKENHEKEETKILNQGEALILKITSEFKEKESEIGAALKEGTQEMYQEQREKNIIMPCPVCKQGNLVIKFAKKSRRYFAACDKYPECKATYSLPPNALIKTTGKSQDNLPILVAIRKGKKPWEFQFNPNWKAEQPKD